MSNLLAAFCIPLLMSCGAPEEPVDLTIAREAAPALMLSDGAPEPPVQMAMQQAPVENRVQKRLLDYCVDELRAIELEMREEEKGSKYYRFLESKKKTLLRRCVDKYK